MAELNERGLSFSAKEIVIVAGAGAGLIILFYWLAKREVKQAAGAVADGVKATADAVGKVVKPVVTAINPASQDNIVQKVGSAIVKAADPKAVTQDTGLTTKVLDWLKIPGSDYDPNK